MPPVPFGLDLSRPVLLVRSLGAEQRPFRFSDGQSPTCALILPLVEIDEREAAAQLGIPAASLAVVNQDDFDVFQLAEELAPHIIRLVDGAAAAQPLWRHCANDLYTYHFKDQYFLLRLVELLVDRWRPERIGIAGGFRGPYRSPERPAVGFHYDQAEASTWLIESLLRETATPFEHVSTPQPPRPWWSRTLRRAAFAGVKNLKLAKRVLKARRSPVPIAEVVWVHRGPSEVGTMKPIIAEARNLGLTEIHLQDDVLHAEGTAPALEKEGMAFVPVGAMKGFGGFLRSVADRAKAGAPRIGPSWRLPDGLPASLRVQFSPEVVRELVPRLGDSFLHQALLAQELGALLRACGAKAAVTASMVDNMGPSMAWAAAKEGAAVIAIQNALQNPERYPLMGWADSYCVQSSRLRLMQIEAGCPPDRIEATGLAHLQVKADLERVHSDAPSRLCVTTQPLLHGQNIALLEAAERLCRRHSLELLIKLHPREDPALYAGIPERLSQQGVKVVLEHKSDTAAALARSSLMFSRVSTTVLMAISAGTPAMVYLPPDFRHWKIDYLSHPVTTACQSFEELEEAADKALEDYPAFIERYRALRLEFVDQSSRTDSPDSPALAAAKVVLRHARRGGIPKPSAS